MHERVKVTETSNIVLQRILKECDIQPAHRLGCYKGYMDKSIGLLYQPPIKKILGFIPKTPPERLIGVLHTHDPNWLLEAYGRNNLGLLVYLANEISTEFEKDIDIQLTCELEKEPYKPYVPLTL
jgi:hypothetical protein